MGRRKVKNFSLFGKLKPFDYLLLIAVILVIIIAYKFIHQENKFINITALSTATTFQSNSIHIGDYETDSSGKKIAEITNFEVVDAPVTNDTQFASKILILNIKILTTVNKGGQIQYKNQPIATGSQVQFNFNSISVQSYISEISGIDRNNQLQSKIITINLYGQYPWLADHIKVGDYQTGASGEKILQIISKDVHAAQVTNTASDGESVVTTDPSKVDIVIKVKAELQKINKNYILQGYNNIFIGKNITLTINNIQINNGLISDIN